MGDLLEDAALSLFWSSCQSDRSVSGLQARLILEIFICLVFLSSATVESGTY